VILDAGSIYWQASQPKVSNCPRILDVSGLVAPATMMAGPPFVAPSASSLGSGNPASTSWSFAVGLLLGSQRIAEVLYVHSRQIKVGVLVRPRLMAIQRPRLMAIQRIRWFALLRAGQCPLSSRLDEWL
jgi:hypothetical protein